MIFFEIDGIEYTVSVPTPDSIPFTTPEGVTYWMQKPAVAECYASSDPHQRRAMATSQGRR